MNYTLKDKLNVTKEFLDELTEKSWQEIEHIQSQLANLTDTKEGNQVRKLLNNLLTSYYVFVGGLENFDTVDFVSQTPLEVLVEPAVAEEPEPRDEPVEPIETVQVPVNDLEVSEPFEYFVDFDEPDLSQPKLTDADLYNI